MYTHIPYTYVYIHILPMLVERDYIPYRLFPMAYCVFASRHVLRRQSFARGPDARATPGARAEVAQDEVDTMQGCPSLGIGHALQFSHLVAPSRWHDKVSNALPDNVNRPRIAITSAINKQSIGNQYDWPLIQYPIYCKTFDVRNMSFYRLYILGMLKKSQCT